MSINIHILNNTDERSIIPPDLEMIRRTNSKVLKSPQLILFNKNASPPLSMWAHSQTDLHEKFLKIASDYGIDLGRESPRRYNGIISTYKKLFLVLKAKYKIKVVYYSTRSYYGRYSSQLVGLLFEDKKYHATFLLRYGHLFH